MQHRLSLLIRAGHHISNRAQNRCQEDDLWCGGEHIDQLHRNAALKYEDYISSRKWKKIKNTNLKNHLYSLIWPIRNIRHCPA